MIDFDNILKSQTLDSQTIQQANIWISHNPNKRLYIDIPNTRGVSSELVKQLDERVAIRIAGGYDEDRVKRLGDVNFVNGETGEIYTTAVIYSRNETIKIISEMEKIEKGFEGKDFSQFEKIVYIYDKLKAGIFYDPNAKKDNMPSSEIRSLRGLITKKCVCAGYSLIFKEMMDRQGIVCHYVKGETRKGVGHAWNIITMNERNYPVDLTWDNSQYRMGNFNAYDYLGQDANKFKKDHIPMAGEKCENYELSQFDSETIKNISKKIKLEKSYESTSYTLKRKDNSKILIAQIDEVTRQGEKYFKYFYADKLKDGRIVNQNILYSKNNFTYFIEAKKSDLLEKELEEEFLDEVKNTLFSKGNIRYSQSKGSSYIGELIASKADGKIILEKDSNKEKLFRYPIKEITRSNGSSFVIEEMGQKEIQGVQVSKYLIFELVNEKNMKVIKKNEIYSEQDILNDNRQAVADFLLDRDRIDKKTKESGGYIGEYTDHKVKINNPRLEKYFREIHPGGIGKNKNKTFQEGQRKKLEWIRQFIQDYEAIERDMLYDIRARDEEKNMRIIAQTVRKGYFSQYYENPLYKGSGDIKNVILEMLRLLKAADNLTIDGGRNFLLEFSNIPEINQVLLQIKGSKERQILCDKANMYRENHKCQNHKKTSAEIDKEKAQKYLNFENAEKMYAYMEDIVDKSDIVTFKENTNKLSPERDYQVAVLKIICKQKERSPGKVEKISNGGWQINLDTSIKINEKER